MHRFKLRETALISVTKLIVETPIQSYRRLGRSESP
jgi:hypothetical protein